MRKNACVFERERERKRKGGGGGKKFMSKSIERIQI